MPRSIARRGSPWKSPSTSPAAKGDEMIAVLRRGTAATDEQLTIRFGSDSDVHLELTYPAGTVLEGAWKGVASSAGKSLKAEDIWEEVCWHSDEDVDYLEIQQTLSGGWKRQRQFCSRRTGSRFSPKPFWVLLSRR